MYIWSGLKQGLICALMGAHSAPKSQNLEASANGALSFTPQFKDVDNFHQRQLILQSEDERGFNRRPVVVWHGLGDNYNSSGMLRVAEVFRQVKPGIEVYLIAIDANPSKDEDKSLVGDANDQVDLVCEQIQSNSVLKDGFDAVGFSQGGVLLRGLIERCKAARVHNFITFGSPHMGVMELPLCENDKDWVCKQRNAFLKRQVWQDSIQSTIIPAQYFRDPYDYEKYVQHSHFLADINNERSDQFNSSYTNRLAALDKFVLITFLKDRTVVPPNSAWFEDTDINTGSSIPFDATDLYKRDLIGLKNLNEENKLVFLSIDEEHMRIPDTVLADVASDYLGELL